MPEKNAILHKNVILEFEVVVFVLEKSLEAVDKVQMNEQKD